MREERREDRKECLKDGKQTERKDHHHTHNASCTAHSQACTERTGSCLICSLERSMPGLALRMSASSSFPKMLTGVTAALDGDLLVGVTEPVCIGEREGGEKQYTIIINHG